MAIPLDLPPDDRLVGAPDPARDHNKVVKAVRDLAAHVDGRAQFTVSATPPAAGVLWLDTSQEL